MFEIEEQIKNEQVLQIIKKLSFFEELALYIESNGGTGVGIDQVISSRGLYRDKLVKLLSEDTM